MAEFVDATIYKYTNRINGKVYIGQTIHERQRYSRHKNAHEYSYFHNAIKKYGFDSFDYEIITSVCCPKAFYKEILNKCEIYYIQLYKSNDKRFGYNIDKGGSLGGRSKGFICSDEIKANMSKAQKNKTISEETKSKISNTLKGQYVGSMNPNHREILMYDKEMNLIKEFGSIMDAVRYFNKTNSSTICNCLNNRCKSAYGFIWKYKE